MSLIDRQEAIEKMARAIWLYPNELYPTLCHYQNAKDLAEYGLRDVSEVEPEENCDSCKYGYFGNQQCDNCRVRYPSHYERGTDE